MSPLAQLCGYTNVLICRPASLLSSPADTRSQTLNAAIWTVELPDAHITQVRTTPSPRAPSNLRVSIIVSLKPGGGGRLFSERGLSQRELAENGLAVGAPWAG